MLSEIVLFEEAEAKAKAELAKLREFYERQARIDRALAAIAEATEDADEQRNEPV